MQKGDSFRYLVSLSIPSEIFFENLNLISIVLLTFSDTRLGFKIAEYPRMDLFLSSLPSRCRTALSVIVNPIPCNVLAISCEETRAFLPRWESMTLSMSSSMKKYHTLLLILISESEIMCPI